MANRDEFDRASDRAAARSKEGPRAVGVRYDLRSRRIVVRLSNGLHVSFLPSKAEGLEAARPVDLETIEISPSGFGLHFPKLDADLYLPALLEGFMGSKRWMAARLGGEGGRVRSPAKTAASRKNGKLGGRPRKSARA